MTNVQAALLGLVQGLTEFLPLSSSGHLVVLQKALGFENPPVTFDVVVHSGSLIAIVLFFHKKILNINKQLFKAIVVASLPTAIIGLFFNRIEDVLFNSIEIVAWALLITSLLLLSTIFLSKTEPANRKISSLKDAIIIGIAQGLAIIPGISRSGATIVSGLWLGLKREEAVTFAFLISIPAVVGAQILKLPGLIDLETITASVLLIGFSTAVISGLASLRLLRMLVQSSKLHIFAIYTFILSFSLFLLS